MPLRLEAQHIAVHLRDSLLELMEFLPLLCELCLQGIHFTEPSLHTAHCVQSRPTRVMKTATKRTAAIHLVAIECNGIQALAAPHVSSRNVQARAYDCLAKYLLECRQEVLVERKLAQHYDGIWRVWILCVRRTQSVQWHERDTATLLLLQQAQERGRCLVRIDHNMEE